MEVFKGIRNPRSVLANDLALLTHRLTNMAVKEWK
jgi:hypothetical protein